MNRVTVTCEGVPAWALPYLLQHISRNAGQHGLEVSGASITARVELLGAARPDVPAFSAWVREELDNPGSGFSGVQFEEA